MLLTASESPPPPSLVLFDFLPSPHHTLVESHSHHAPLPPGIALAWSPSRPAPSLLEHNQGGLFCHHLEVRQRKFPEQVRETQTHSPLLPPVTSPSSSHGTCREALGLSRYLLSTVCTRGGSTRHSPVTHSSCKEVKTQGLFPL